MSGQKPSTTPAPAPALAGASGHNLALDGVRGLAILLVMWMHMTLFHPANALERGYHIFAEFGHTGVDLFFVLSGFLITGILYDSKLAIRAQQESGGAGRFFGNFYARRTLRIFPLYYAVVAFSLILVPHAGELLNRFLSPQKAELVASKLARFQGAEGYGAWFWLYLSNIPIARLGDFLHGILGISWSLAIEEQFYLAWPLLVWFLPRRGAIGVCAGLAVLALLCRCAMIAYMIKSGAAYSDPPPKPAPEWFNPIGVYVLTPCRIDNLALGSLAALLLRGSISLDRLLPWARAAVPVCVLAALAMALGDVLLGWSMPKYSVSFGPLFQTLGFSFTGLAALGTLILAIASRPGGLWYGFWTSRIMRTLGKYAYALYLFHLPIRALIRDTLFGAGPDISGVSAVAGNAGGPRIPFSRLAIFGSELPAQFLFYIIAIGASLAAAWVSWVCFENQILKLKKFFPSGVEQPKSKKPRA